MDIPFSRYRLSRWLILAVLLGLVAVTLYTSLPISSWLWLWGRLSIFATVFLGIFIEAVPFLLMGTLLSGLVDVFVSEDWLARLSPRRALPAALVGASLGFIFPICECGTVPLTRRLFRKGLPLPAGIAFLLAAPVLNPIVIFSTSAAFGWGRMLAWRLGLSLIIAVIVGLAFSVEKEAANILRPSPFEVELPVVEVRRVKESFLEKLRHALLISTDEFFEMGRYLVLGASLAGLLQTFISQTSLLAIGNGPLLSVLVMLALAVILSICSTVDAFIAIGFASTFSFGSVLSFLVFGPMVDVKSILMFMQVFRRRTVFYLVLLPFLLSLLAGLAFNYFSF
ncbi:MAG TPA: permease [Anaerolineales bacterium]|nr:permease [Anaerolineales bacterium]